MFVQKCRLQKGLNRRKYRADYKETIKMLEKEVGANVLNKTNIIIKYRLMLFGNWLAFIFCVIYSVLQLIYRWFRELKWYCPKPHPERQPGEVFYIIGHRGAAAHEIENTIPAFEKALTDYGANALEIDLCFTKDEQVVIWHDWDPDSFLAIARQAGLEPDVKYRPFAPPRGDFRLPVPQLKLEELKKHYGYAFKKKYPTRLAEEVPSLNEFMDWAKDEPKLKLVILDCKIPPDDIHLLPKMLGRITVLIDQYNPHYAMLVMTPEDEIIKGMIDQNPNLDYTKDIVFPPGIVLHPEGFSAVQTAIDFKINHASAGRPTILELAPWTTYRRLVQHDVQLKKKHNDENNNSTPDIKGFIGWTINERSEMKCLLKLGIDGLVTDHPQKLFKVVKKLNYKTNDNTC